MGFYNSFFIELSNSQENLLTELNMFEVRSFD